MEELEHRGYTKEKIISLVCERQEKLHMYLTPEQENEVVDEFIEWFGSEGVTYTYDEFMEHEFNDKTLMTALVEKYTSNHSEEKEPILY